MASNEAVPQRLPWFPWIGTRKRPFYGWVIVGVSSSLQFCAGLITQGFGAYLEPLQREFGWSKTVLAAPRSLSQFDGAVLGPVNGFLVDRFGPRLNVALGSFFFGLGLILFGLQRSLWQYFVTNIIVDVGASLGGLLLVSVMINGWFRRKRSIANALGLTGYAIAGIIGVPVLVWILTTFGWRAAAITSGLFVWALGIPCTLLVRSSPEPFGILQDGDTPESLQARAKKGTPGPGDPIEFTLRQALRTRSFWLLSMSNGLNGMAMSAMMVHRFAFLKEDANLSAATVALIWMAASITNIPSRLVGGFIGDRVSKRLIVGVSISLIGLSLVFLALSTSLLLAMAFGITYGVGWGMRTPVTNALYGEYFGRTALGKIQGALASVAVPLTILGPLVAAVMADHLGGYRLAFLIMAAAAALGAILQFMAAAPKLPATKSAAMDGASA